ncbi:hypothetical protein [Geodermatophilus chilensis]|uniref:hypothetical protein n=1 Tax=Geodermatophilus chilensis TaxID=2035835 RepID=UPI0012FFDF16|nr:hypothetical protein [Geodermatophilus chilensis]
MTILVRLGAAVLVLVGLVLVLAGGALLWADAALDDRPARPAEVVLAGPRATDVDLPVEGTGRVAHVQVLTHGDVPRIGSSVDVQVVDDPARLARLAGDERWGIWGLVLTATGMAVLVVVLVVVLRRRNRDRAGWRDSRPRGRLHRAAPALRLQLDR